MLTGVVAAGRGSPVAAQAHPCKPNDGFSHQIIRNYALTQQRSTSFGDADTMKHLLSTSIAVLLLFCAEGPEAHTGEQMVIVPVDAVQLDGKLSEWAVNGAWVSLSPISSDRDEQGNQSDAPLIKLGLDPTGQRLFIAVKGEFGKTGTSPRIDVFLDVEHGYSIDRPAQFVLRDNLQAAQDRHRKAVKAARTNTEGEWAAEFSLDLSALGLPHGDAPAVVGFDIEVESGNASYGWTDGEDKWLNRRRLGDIILSGERLSLQTLSGETAWQGGAFRSPPGYVHVTRENGQNFFVRERVDGKGRFSLRLPPGNYTVMAADSRTLSRLAERQTVRISDEDKQLAKPLRASRPDVPLDVFVPALMEREQVRAVGLGIVKGGDIRFVKTYGVEADDDEVTEDTVFDVASITKTVATMVVLSLVDDGLWNLDAPLSDFYVDPDISDDPRHRGLTTRLVLRHLTGLPNWREDDRLGFLFSPGERQSYSGEAFEYLRRALEARFEVSFETLAERYVFAPAGMTGATFVWSESTGGHFAGRYYGNHDFNEPSVGINIAGNLFATPRDLAYFLAWVADGAGLSKALWKEMITPNNSSLLEEKTESPYGLGWALSGDGKELVLEHGGSEMGSRAYVAFAPQTGDGIVVLTNGAGGRPIIRSLFEATVNRGGGWREISNKLATEDELDQ